MATVNDFIKQNVREFLDYTVEDDKPEEKRIFIETLINKVQEDPIASEAFEKPLVESAELIRAIFAAKHYAMCTDTIPEIINPLCDSLVAFIRESMEW